jgi:methionine synthase II (cobalamin-independent)
MKCLTLQDYIDLEKIKKAGTGDFEQNSFIISRYLKLDINKVKSMDIRVVQLIMKEIEEHMEEFAHIHGNHEITPLMITAEINRVEEENNIEDEIENRFDILDMESKDD